MITDREIFINTYILLLVCVAEGIKTIWWKYRYGKRMANKKEQWPP